MVSVKGLKKSYGAKTIFDDANFTLSHKEIAGLVGINGSGKSTLFKILAGEDQEFEGAITHNTKEPLIGHMTQQVTINDHDLTIIDFLKKYTGFNVLEDELNSLMEDLENPEKLEKYSDVYEKFEKVGGYEFDYRAEKTINQLGLAKYNLESNINNLSGGEKRKLLLCGTLIKGGDLLLLDEPTNDLDTSSIQGLVTLLKESLAGCLIISHDQDFLNKVTNKIFEIHDQKITQYSGNYEFYEQQKKLLYRQHADAYNKQLEEEERIKKSTQELRQKAQAIGNRGNTRDNDKGDGASKVEKKLAQRAKAMENRIEKAEKIEKPKIIKPLQIHFPLVNEPVGGMMIEGINFSYGTNDNFTLQTNQLYFGPKDKILISGENGSGKSTFLKILTGDIKTENNSVKMNDSLRIGYFSQANHDLPHSTTAIDFLHTTLGFPLTEVHGILGGMGFDDLDRKQLIGLLSPGMRLRLMFAIIALQKNNCLILDEPTNHVDVEIKEALKKAITEFPGMVIMVSHDSNFVHDLTFSKKVTFKNGVGIEQ